MVQAALVAPAMSLAPAVVFACWVS